MPEAATARWSPAQQSMLRELGCELFALRGAPSAAASPVPAERPQSTVSARAPNASAPRATPAARPRRTLVVLSPDANWLRGPHARLARGILAALGVREDDVRGEMAPGAPVLAFGTAANRPVHPRAVSDGASTAHTTPAARSDTVHAPALAALRDARAKRALWPALRTLRRRLRDADTQG